MVTDTNQRLSELEWTARLRQQAEELLRTAPQKIRSMPFKDAEHFVHELQIYQVELEMQNQELGHAQNKLETSHDQYRDLYDFAPVSYLTLDYAGRIKQANLTAAGLLGVDRARLQHTLLAHFIVPEDQDILYLHRQAVQNNGTTQACELRIHDPQGGSPRDIRLETRVARGETNTPLVYHTVLFDITEHKRADALREAKSVADAANLAKSEFLATMSHELRTPLAVIIGYTDLLIEDTFGTLSTEQKEVMRKVWNHAEELHELISDLLDLSRLEAHHLPLAINPVSLEQLLNELEAETQGLREQSGLTFVWQQAAELPVLHTDSRKLKVVIKNLISNAVKFTEHGKIMIATQARNNGVEISVTDTGIGIPAEAMATIFEPFRQLELSMTRRYKGTGLGLHIVKRMLELLDGLISVESEVGCGSTFRVWIPLRASRS